MKNGTVLLIGRPNVGKSSVFNALAGTNRAIVTPIPGTTRDLLTENVEIEGIPVSLVDTAGWRDTSDLIEREGVERGEHARQVADLILLVLDASEALTSQDTQLLEATSASNRIVALNKSDLEIHLNTADVGPVVAVSALRRKGLDTLRTMMGRVLAGGEPLSDSASISNTRHIALLEQCRESLRAAQRAASTDRAPEEFVLVDLQAARRRLDEIVGTRTSEDVLQHIFERFCIGK